MPIARLGSGDALAVILCWLGRLTVCRDVDPYQGGEGAKGSGHANKTSAGTAKDMFLHLLLEDRSAPTSATREGVVRCRTLLVLSWTAYMLSFRHGIIQAEWC